MDKEPNPKSWWSTLPGILTAMSGIITAVAGLIVSLHQAGVFDEEDKQVPQHQDIATKPAEATKTVAIAETIHNPTVTKTPKVLDQPKRINLLATENGGHLLAASSDNWLATIDGKESWKQIDYGIGKEAVYGFKDEQPATFDTFTMLIPVTEDNNVREFELLIGNDSPTGEFESIGKFQTQNVKLFKTPYQEFGFPPVTAKYLKFKLLHTYGDPHPGIYEFQLFGNLK